jgi:hypothetical protein
MSSNAERARGEKHAEALMCIARTYVRVWHRCALPKRGKLQNVCQFDPVGGLSMIHGRLLKSAFNLKVKSEPEN